MIVVSLPIPCRLPSHLVSFECVHQLAVCVDVPVSASSHCGALHHTTKADEQVCTPTDLQQTIGLARGGGAGRQESG
jgi:hypothetical protein